MVAVADIPIFPTPWCAVPPLHKMCHFLGISLECVAAVDKDGVFGTGFIAGHILTSLALWIIGIVYLSRARGGESPMLITTSLYSIITGFFALFRLEFEIGPMLLMGAALHNLAEWSIVIHCAFRRGNKRFWLLIIAFAWILAVVFFVWIHPEMTVVVIIEQASGIMLDFAMPMMFFNMYWLQGKEFYARPFWAHSIHIVFTIVPLVLANFFVGNNSWFSAGLEFAVYVSAPVTHVLYCSWAIDFDEGNFPGEYQEVADPDEGPKEGPEIREDLKLRNVWYYLIAGFFLGLIPLVVVPMALGECELHPFCTPGPELLGTAIATVKPGLGPAFENRIASVDLVKKARAAPGNIKYEFFKNARDENEYRFVEEWESLDHLQQWLGGFPKTIFGQDHALQQLLVGGKLNVQGGYSRPLPADCSPFWEGGTSIILPRSCGVVWRSLSNWKGDCTWIPDCRRVLSYDEEDDMRILEMTLGENRHQKLEYLSNRDKKMQYTISSPASHDGYSGEISLEPMPSGCALTYTFTVPKKKMSLNEGYSFLYGTRVPGLKAKFHPAAGSRRSNITFVQT